MFGDKDTVKEELKKKFDEFKKKFYSTYVCTASSANVGSVMASINDKLLGIRALVVVPNSTIDKDGKFRIDLIVNPRFEASLHGIYQTSGFYDLERFMRDFTPATFDLEVKAFVMGLHALNELRERITDLEVQVSAMAKELRRERRAPRDSYLSKVNR